MEYAVFHFISQTITRSLKHRLFLATYGGFGAAFEVMTFGSGPSGLLILPLTLSFILISGLRAAFNVPAELSANWAFQLSEVTCAGPYLAAARKWTLVCAILPLFLLMAPMEFACFPPAAALFHLAYGITTSALLMQVMFFGLRKVPFTCAHLPGKFNLVFLALVYISGFSAYSSTLSRLEASLTRNPAAMPAFFALAAALYLSARALGEENARTQTRTRLRRSRRAGRPHARPHHPLRRNVMLEIRGLTKYYRNNPVVNDVSFTLKPGEVTGYLGPNGSGKSTTVKIITALIEPTDGKVLLDGKDIRDDLIAFKRRLGYVPEEAILYSYLTGLEYLQLMGCLRSMPPAEVERKANDLLQLFQLHSYRHAPISAYSKGMKQRILISAALLHDPDVLILDEPLSGIDVTSALLFKHLLSELARRGKMILYISHVLEVVEKVCAQVIIIYRGRIMAADSVERLRDLTKVPSLEEIFSQLVEHRDLESVARDIACAIQR